MRVYTRRRRSFGRSRAGVAYLFLFLAVGFSISMLSLGLFAEANVNHEGKTPTIVITNGTTVVIGEHLCGTVLDDTAGIRIEATVGGRQLAGSPDTTSDGLGGTNHFCFPVPPILNAPVVLVARDKDGNEARATIRVVP